MKIKRMNSNPLPPEQNPNQSWERNTLEKLLLQVYKEQRSTRIWRWVGRGIALLFGLMLLAGLVGGRQDVNKLKGAHTAVIELNGVIDSANDNANKLIEGLEAAYANPNVKGIILRANSPGGSPVISNIAFEEIRRIKAQHKNIPLYVVAEDVCASGCYYIASAADKIYADPSSLVGSIGVISGGFGFTGLMDKLGIERRLRTAGENKGMGDPFSPENPEQEALWNKVLQDTHQTFIQAVKTGRGDRLKFEQNPDVFSGRIYSGTEGKQVGLVDDLGNLYSVSRDVLKAPTLVDYTPKDDFSKTLGRRFGVQFKQGLQSLSGPGW